MPTVPKEEGIAEWVIDQWRRGDDQLREDRRNYWLNLSFIEDEQWVWWSKKRREVAEFPRADNDDRVRLSDNRMQPNLITLMAKLTRRNLDFEVPPDDANDAALGGAKLGEFTLRCEHDEADWARTRLETLHAEFLGGTSAVAVEWDPNAGKVLGELEGRKVYEGRATLSPLTITEFMLQPGARNVELATYWIIAKAMPPSDVKDWLDLDEEPRTDDAGGHGPLQRRLWASSGFSPETKLTTVYILYHRPTKGTPKGRYVIVVNGKAEHDAPWPFWSEDDPEKGFKDLNGYVFNAIPLPMRWNGWTPLNAARPLQVAYNLGISNLSEHMKLAGNARMSVPEGSVKTDDWTDEPGEIIYYDGMSGGKPEWVAPPNLPRWLVEHVARLRAAIDDVMNVHDISRGVAPGDRNSGLALSVLAEKDETPLGLIAGDQARGWAAVASKFLKLMEKFVVEYRESSYTSQGNLPVRKEWNGKMLHGQTRVIVPLDNVMPHSKVALQAWITNITDRFPTLRAGFEKDPTALARLLDLPGAAMLNEVIDADAAAAQCENEVMAAGEIPNLDGRPYPMPWDNHPRHIAEHNRFRKSKGYVYATPEVRWIFDQHIMAHETLAKEEMLAQMQLNAGRPGLATVPQGNEPLGSFVPPDFAEMPMMPPGGGGSPAQPEQSADLPGFAA